MPKFLVVHPMPRKVMEAMMELPPDENKQVIELRSHCSADAYWIRSWSIPDLEKLFCEWNAKDAESIKEALKPVKWIATEGIYEMTIVEAESFREKTPEITV
ncbi:MAG: nickel-binding protein [Candidatus Odinarchaeota archaeon]